jgi:hypothetical protein
MPRDPPAMSWGRRWQHDRDCCLTVHEVLPRRFRPGDGLAGPVGSTAPGARGPATPPRGPGGAAVKRHPKLVRWRHPNLVPQGCNDRLRCLRTQPGKPRPDSGATHSRLVHGVLSRPSRRPRGLVRRRPVPMVAGLWRMGVWRRRATPAVAAVGSAGAGQGRQRWSATSPGGTQRLRGRRWEDCGPSPADGGRGAANKTGTRGQGGSGRSAAGRQPPRDRLAAMAHPTVSAMRRRFAGSRPAGRRRQRAVSGFVPPRQAGRSPARRRAQRHPGQGCPLASPSTAPTWRKSRRARNYVATSTESVGAARRSVDNRRVANGGQHRMVTGAALAHPVSQVWAGYWQRGDARVG